MTNAKQQDDDERPSLVQQLVSLDIGQSVSQARRLDGDEATKEVMTETNLGMRNTLNAAVRRAKDRSGQDYTVEGGQIITRSLDILCVVVVTRIA